MNSMLCGIGAEIDFNSLDGVFGRATELGHQATHNGWVVLGIHGELHVGNEILVMTESMWFPIPFGDLQICWGLNCAEINLDLG